MIFLILMGSLQALAGIPAQDFYIPGTTILCSEPPEPIAINLGSCTEEHLKKGKECLRPKFNEECSIGEDLTECIHYEVGETIPCENWSTQTWTEE